MLREPLQARDAAAGAVPVPSVARSLVLGLAKAYAGVMHGWAMWLGLLFLLQAIQGGRDLGQGAADEDGLKGFMEAARLLVGNFMMPFSEMLAVLVFPSEMLSFKVLGFWVPALLGVLICSAGVLGHLSMKFRWAIFVIPYASLAVVNLVWQIELNKMLPQVAAAEDLSAMQQLRDNDNERVMSFQYAMFEAPYEAFVSVYSEQQCSATMPSKLDEPVRLECMNESLEGQVIQFAVAEFCRARQAESREQVEHFGRRVEACKVQGQNAKILPAKAKTREAVFCRCRAALYDWFRFISSWIIVFWCAQLLGVVFVLYSSVEPNIAKMDPVQHREVLGFIVVGVALLVGRVTLLAEYFDDDSLVGATS